MAVNTSDLVITIQAFPGDAPQLCTYEDPPCWKDGRWMINDSIETVDVAYLACDEHVAPMVAQAIAAEQSRD